jgi:hypothetical protein
VDLILVLPNEAALEDRRRLREAVPDLEFTHGLRLDPAPGSLKLVAQTEGVSAGSWGFNFTASEKYRSECDQHPA